MDGKEINKKRILMSIENNIREACKDFVGKPNIKTEKEMQEDYKKSIQNLYNNWVPDGFSVAVTSTDDPEVFNVSLTQPRYILRLNLDKEEEVNASG